MKRVNLIPVILLILCLAGTVLADSFRQRTLPTKPAKAFIGQGFDRRHVEVKFLDDVNIGLSTSGIPYDRSNRQLTSADVGQLMQNIADAGGTWKRMSSVGEQLLDERRITAEKNLNRALADLNNYFILTVPNGVSVEDWIDRLNSLNDIEIALAMPLPVQAPLVPGNFESSQGYLNNAPNGIGASAAWSQPGGTGWPSVGGPIRICDFEYSWNLTHQEIPFASFQNDPFKIPSDPFSDNNHGTAVLGEIRSLPNGWGTTGAAHSTLIYVSPTYLDGSWQLGSAMTWMLGIFGAGDVFLIEQQMAGPNFTGVPPGTQDGLIPVEWWASWYNIILTAVGNGIHVVEAAGNGRENLDAAIYSTGNGGHWPFLPQNNSGAVIVGAGAAPAMFGGSDTDRSRLWFSNYGSRLDLQGWGERVVTIGYGDLYSAEGTNLWYTNTFSGTSSASPIVASAVAILESIFEEQTGGTKLSPMDMRNLLVSTGSPQQAGSFPLSENIGPRPDLTAAIAGLPLGCCIGVVGNIDCDLGNIVDISDLTELIDYLFINPNPALCCLEEANINGDTQTIIDISDLTKLIGYLFIDANPVLLPCP